MELAQSKRVADRVKAVFESVPQQVGHRLVRPDILDQENIANTIDQFAVIQPPRRRVLPPGGCLLVGAYLLVEEPNQSLPVGCRQPALVRRRHIPGINMCAALQPEFNTLVVGAAAERMDAKPCGRFCVFVARRAMICEQRWVSER